MTRTEQEALAFWRRKISLPLPGFETRIDQYVAHTLHRLSHPSRLLSSGRAVIRMTPADCRVFQHDRFRKNITRLQYWVQSLRKVLYGSKIRQFITKFMHYCNLYLLRRTYVLCESHTVSMVTAEHCLWVTSQIDMYRRYSCLMNKGFNLNVY